MVYDLYGDRFLCIGLVCIHVCCHQCLGMSVWTILTLHQFHDDVDGLFLGTHANQLHNVGVVILLQNSTDELQPKLYKMNGLALHRHCIMHLHRARCQAALTQ